jgi:hypothetical protein
MARSHTTSNLLTIQPFQWAFLTIFVLLIGPLIVASLFSDTLFRAYARDCMAPRLQSEFGFRMEKRRMYYGRQPLNVFVIQGIKRDGILARIGIRNGDIPIGMFHMSDVNFYWTLERSRTTPVEIRLIRCNDYKEMLRSGDLLMSHHWRKAFLFNGHGGYTVSLPSPTHVPPPLE